MRICSLALASLMLAIAPGCGLLDPTTSDTSTTGTGAAGFGTPTIEVTVSGVHYGPSAPDVNSAVSLVDTYDSNGNLLQSNFSLSASVTSLGVTCVFSATRESAGGVSAIAASSYQLLADTTGSTPDGTVSPGPTVGVRVPQSTLSCSGSDCNGGSLVLSAMDSAHAEGYYGGTYNDSTGAGSADVVCSFYLPMATYTP